MKLGIRRKYNIPQILQFVLLFLVSLNFANLYFYFIFLAFFICVIANPRRLKADNISILLALISICYILFYPPTRDSYTTILKQFSYSMCYIIGLNLFNEREMDKNNHSADKHIKTSILVVASGTFLHYLLNASINIGSLLRNTEDFWTGEVVSATEQALLPVIALGVFSLWLIGDYPIWSKAFPLLGLIMVFAYNFVLAGRTILVLEAIIICVAYFFTNKYMQTKGKIKNHLFIAAILIAGLILFLNNAWGVRDWVINSNLSSRFDTQEALTDIRFTRKITYLSRMLEFPFGGGSLRASIGGHAHELYLDALSDVGIFGYGFIVASVIACMVNVIKLFRSKSLSVETRGLLLCVFLGINVVFFLEPILQGAPWLFCIFCFLCGVMRSERLSLKNSKLG